MVTHNNCCYKEISEWLLAITAATKRLLNGYNNCCYKEISEWLLAITAATKRFLNGYS